jgi:hypothetical protein
MILSFAKRASDPCDEGLTGPQDAETADGSVDDGGRSEGESRSVTCVGSVVRVGGRRGLSGGTGLRRPADVAMMQAADFGNRDDRAEFRRLNRASVGRILVER